MGTTFVRILVFCLITFGLFTSAEAKRVALVIGNSAYQHASPLANPKNDADALAAVLKRLDFEVVKGIDLKQLEFEKTVRKFARTIRGADTALLFYAGHGLQVGGRNYLAPVDAKLSDEADLDFETLPLETILKQMEREVKTNLVFLDACRDNPLARNLARSMGTRSANVGRGLARIDSGVGTLIAFATEPGNVALDGKGRNSPFTQALLKHIETPGLDIAQMMRRVRRDVMQSTAQRQVPWNNSSLTGDFYFAGKVTITAGNPPQDDKRITELQDELKKLKEELKNKPAPQQQPRDDAKLSALQKELAELREELKKRPAAKPEPRDDKKVAALQQELRDLKNQLDAQSKGTNNVKPPFTTEKPSNAREQDRFIDQSQGKAKIFFDKGYTANLGNDFENAFKFWTISAEAGNSTAMYNIARFYRDGKGTRKSPQEFVRWLEKSAESGNGQAMLELAVINQQGTVLRKDLSNAARWYAAAADKGISAANYGLAQLHDRGSGVRRDQKAAAGYMFEALRWGHALSLKEMTTNARAWSLTFRRELQRLMKQEGVYAGAIDGQFGPGTQRAVEALAGNGSSAKRAAGFVPDRIDYDGNRSGSYLRCFDPDRNIVFSHEPYGMSNCGGLSYRISEQDFERFRK